MGILTNLKLWLEGSSLYQDYLSKFPAPLNNIYVDTIILLFAIISLCFYIKDSLKARKAHKLALENKKRREEEEAERFRMEQERRREEDESRRRRDKMLEDQLKVSEMDMLQRNMERRASHDDMMDILKTMSVGMAASGFSAFNNSINNQSVNPKNAILEQSEEIKRIEQHDIEDVERMRQEIKKLKKEKAQIINDFEIRDANRQSEITNMQKVSKEKEAFNKAEIERLSLLLTNQEKEYTQSVTTIRNSYEEKLSEKESNINELKLKLDNTDNNEEITYFRGEINRLHTEIDTIKKNKEAEIQQIETDFRNSVTEKELKIDKLSNEISRINKLNTEEIQKLTDERTQEQKQFEQKIMDIENAHKEEMSDLQSKLDEMKEHSKVSENNRLAQIEELYNQLNTLKAQGNDITSETANRIVALENALKKANDLNSNITAQKEKELNELFSELQKANQMNEQKEQALLELSSQFEEFKLSSIQKMDTLYSKLDEAKSKNINFEKIIADRENEIVTLQETLAQTELTATQERTELRQRIMELQNQKEDILVEKTKNDKNIEEVVNNISDIKTSINEKENELKISQTSLETDIITEVTKPVFSTINETESEFDRLMAQFQSAEQKAENVKKQEEEDKKMAEIRKKILDDQLKIEYQEEEKKSSVNDEDMLSALDIQKQKAYDQVKKEEEKAKNPKKPFNIFGKK